VTDRNYYYCLLWLFSGCFVIPAWAQVPCNPAIAQCSPTTSDKIHQAPAGLDLAVQRYYAHRQSKMNLTQQYAMKLERDLQRCLPSSYRSIMRRVVRHESGSNPFAVNINAGPRLERQPQSAAESAQVARSYIAKGYSVDLGYAQINSQHYAHPEGFLKKAGYGVEDMLDPCTNLRAGALILGEAYLRYGDIKQALSVYNTGNTTRGFANGYVDKVLKGR
jgi:type IV secretion system protein VirB1